jgi:hypothetical protein
MSLRDKIFSAQDIPSELVEVPEWGLTVEVRGMSGADRTRIIEIANIQNGNVDLQALYPEIVIATAHDPETGMRVFEADDRTALMSKSAIAVDRLALAGMALSGFTEQAQAAAGKQFPDESAQEVSV